MQKSPKQKVPKVHITKAYILHFVVLPVILIGSDLLIGFFGYYTGSVSEMTLEGFINHILTMPWERVLMIFFVAITIVAFVEAIVRLHVKGTVRQHKK